MKTTIKIDECESPFCEIHTPEVNENIENLAEKISLLGFSGETIILNGWDGDYCIKVMPKDIYRVYSLDKKVFIETEKEHLLLKMRLYEFEELCEKGGWSDFIRISNTDIVNFSHVRNLDMSLAGVIKINLKNDSQAIVSRRYMNKIRSELCLKK